jgi:hypothetical protein
MDRYRAYLEAAVRAFVDAIVRGDLDAADDAAAVAFGWAAQLERMDGRIA